MCIYAIFLDAMWSLCGEQKDVSGSSKSCQRGLANIVVLTYCRQWGIMLLPWSEIFLYEGCCRCSPWTRLDLRIWWRWRAQSLSLLRQALEMATRRIMQQSSMVHSSKLIPPMSSPDPTFLYQRVTSASSQVVRFWGRDLRYWSGSSRMLDYLRYVVIDFDCSFSWWCD